MESAADDLYSAEALHRLQMAIAEVCVGYPMPTIMTAITTFTGAMIGQMHAPDMQGAQQRVRHVAMGMEHMAELAMMDPVQFADLPRFNALWKREH